MIITLGSFSVKVHTVSMFAFVIAFCLLCSLGVWQIQRGIVKQEIRYQEQAEIQDLSNLFTSVERFSKSDLKKLQGQQVHIQAERLGSEIWYVENKIFNKKLGVDVIAVFKLSNSNQVVFINFGWIAVGENRAPRELTQALPDVLNEMGQIQIIELNPFMQGDIRTEQGKKIIQQIDLNVFKREENIESYPILIHVTNKNKFGFRSNWAPSVMTADKHFAYAIQWFGLALCLTIIIIIRAIKWNPQIES
ncbi:SURF1 family protein [Catenovulum maritimum]|nr:SURF1 family protein [Catenovulum maritimum]